MISIIVPLALAMSNVDDFKFQADEKVITNESGLQYVDVKPGDGEAVKAGQLPLVFYTLRLEDGKEIDSNLGKSPFTFVVGKGQVIKGWDEGLLGMKPGGQRKLRIPHELGYGINGIPGAIPGEAVLWFDVEVVGVTEVSMFTEGEKPVKLDSGLQYVDLVAGKGDESAATGDTIVLHYRLFNEDQQLLDTSMQRGRQPFSFRVGSGQVIPGFDEAARGIKTGTVRKVRIPAELGYGAEGSGSVKPNETLWFILEPLAIRKP